MKPHPRFTYDLSRLWRKLTAATVTWTVGQQINFFTQGTLKSETMVQTGENDVHLIIIEDPKFSLSSDLICEIFDTGNHCLSKGSVIEEDQYLYITWSNKGHI